jgi:hypothetical protein
MNDAISLQPKTTSHRSKKSGGLALISFGTTIRSLSNTIREPRGVELDEWKRRAADFLSGDNSISGF